MDHVGEYRLSGSRYRTTLYANLFDEHESDIGRRDDDSQPVAVKHVDAQAPQELTKMVPMEFGRILYYGAASLLLLEWLYALWRYYRTSRV